MRRVWRVWRVLCVLCVWCGGGAVSYRAVDLRRMQGEGLGEACVAGVVFVVWGRGCLIQGGGPAADLGGRAR